MSIDSAVARTFPAFANLDDRSVEDLCTHLRPIQLRPGDVLFRQGERDTALYLLVEGTVDVCIDSGGDASNGVPVAALRAGTVLGELGLLLDVPRTATIAAGTDVVCWQLTRESFSAAIDRSAAWAVQLTLTIASELARRFVDARAEVARLDADGMEHTPRVAELAQLRARLLTEWSF
jgi:CRP/FNR family transcriptional regulator, cyclic AMP receptor protein